MKRLIPFVLATLGMLLSLVLLTAYRSGLFAKVVEIARERIEMEIAESPEVE